MPLPASLLQGIAHPDGGRVVLVVGAGCSVEAPTGLPLARDCALDAHRRLVADGVIADDSCANPEDLSSVADAVKHAQNDSQAALVARLPLRDFRSAEPNEGHRLVAAMMEEHAIKDVVTLNFDLTISSALSNIGTREVSTLTGPHDHSNMGTINLVYLHRNVDAPHEEWILCTEALDNAWQGQWEQVIANALLSSPVTVFVGLGSPAEVLIDSTRRIREAVPDGVDVFQVDPGNSADSGFFEALNIANENYIQLGWVEFMRELEDRLLAEHENTINGAGLTFCNDEGLAVENIDLLCRQIAAMGLLASGRLRSLWLLDETAYLPLRQMDARYLGNLLQALGLIERTLNCVATVKPGGLVELSRDGAKFGTVRPVCGQGLMGWVTMETKLKQSIRFSHNGEQPDLVLVASVSPRPADISPPADLTSDEGPESIVTAQNPLSVLTVDDLRDNPDLAQASLS